MHPWTMPLGAGAPGADWAGPLLGPPCAHTVTPPFVWQLLDGPAAACGATLVPMTAAPMLRAARTMVVLMSCLQSRVAPMLIVFAGRLPGVQSLSFLITFPAWSCGGS